jgi:DNA modification methylase
MREAAARGATPYYRSPSGDVVLYQGDAAAVLRALPAGSVQTCITSPPYWNLRDYSAEGQIGMEPTPAEYVAAIVAVFDQVRRVLRDDGTLWLNLGDSYAADTKWGGSTAGKHAKGLHGCDFIGRNRTQTGLAGKNLVGIPWRVAFALQDAGWILRSDCIWSKPNPMPESVRDRPTRAHEYVFLLSKGPRYFFDQGAVMQPVTGGTHSRGDKKSPPKTLQHEDSSAKVKNNRSFMEATWGAVSARNIRSVWEIPTQAYEGAHFAVFPERLVEPCLLSGSSARGCCSACGTPYTRVAEKAGQGVRNTSAGGNGQQVHRPGANHTLVAIPRETTGWRAGCGCKDAGDPIPCTILDPFVGSGTVPLVARKHGRHSWGIDLSAAYLDLARERLGQLALPGLVAD